MHFPAFVSKSWPVSGWIVFTLYISCRLVICMTFRTLFIEKFSASCFFSWIQSFVLIIIVINFMVECCPSGFIILEVLTSSGRCRVIDRYGCVRCKLFFYRAYWCQILIISMRCSLLSSLAGNSCAWPFLYRWLTYHAWMLIIETVTWPSSWFELEHSWINPIYRRWQPCMLNIIVAITVPRWLNNCWINSLTCSWYACGCLKQSLWKLALLNILRYWLNSNFVLTVTSGIDRITWCFILSRWPFSGLN